MITCDCRADHRTWCEVNPAQMEENFRIIRNRLRPDVKMMSVVKADAYGHGVSHILSALAQSDYFAVACPSEAKELRELGVEKPILVLGYTPPEHYEDLIRYRLSQCVFSVEYGQHLADFLRQKATDKIRVHLKVDTGMSRLGFYAHDAASEDETVAAIATFMKNNADVLDFEGIFTHFAVSEDPDSTFTRQQFQRFRNVLQKLEERNIRFPLRHAANSGAVLNYPEMHLDMVRPGIILYGHYPDRGMADIGLRPVMEMKTRIVQIHHLKQGDTVSYGRRFTADRNMDVATLCLGYADGFSRLLSGKTHFLLRGKPIPLIGSICMDQCIADVTGTDAQPNDEVLVFGRDLPLETHTDAMGTINYELLCMISKRIPRTVVQFR